MKQLFHEKGLANFWEPVEKLIKNGIYLSLQKTDESNLSIGQSKVGGFPDLPEEIDWFTYKDRPMSFLAQINLEEVKPFDLDSKLPGSGILYFFYDSEQGTWGFDPADQGSFKVFFYKGTLDNLKRKPAPSDSDDSFVFESCQLQYRSVTNVPVRDSDLMETVEFSEEEGDRYDAIYAADYGEFGEGIQSKLLGHSSNVQGGMEWECELVTNGLYCGDSSGYESPKAEELKKNIANWNLLLQLHSSDEAGMMWGDCGLLYFWIKEEDLLNENFENCWMILQCH